ncbi:mitochondrial genome maintenance exonuclease 1 [Nelusetta ayraudi]|uniref:mitochondrial genome maintenance exonuclease 1 n=1 Tax=Nelusetta ayraudi TaxID=303726 RepID=UPI003F712FBB
MFSFQRLALTGGIIVPQCASLSMNFSVCHCLLSRKRHSPYSSVDTGRYSSLVKSIMSVRVSSQTPETLKDEDEHIYGPVVKAQTSSPGPKEKLPKTLHPFLLDKETVEPDDLELGPPARILLNRGQGRSSVPSVTRILQQTLSPDQLFYLERWRKKMIAELGEEGFARYSQNLFKQGKRFHSVLEDILSSGSTWESMSPEEKETHLPEVQGYMESVSHILKDIRAVRAIESTVHHDKLNYLGIADCVARYRGVLCVIDWKTSEKPKPLLSNTYDNPIQIAAYAGALNNDPKYKYQVENGLIVVVYKDGSPAHAHCLNSDLMSDYWKRWLVRLEEFNEKRSTNASRTS